MSPLGGQRDISDFYINLDWDLIVKLLGINDLEFLKIKIDEIYDEYFMLVNDKSDDIDVTGFLSRWKYQESNLYKEVLEMIATTDLLEFKLDQHPSTPPALDNPHLLDGLSTMAQHSEINKVEITNAPSHPKQPQVSLMPVADSIPMASPNPSRQNSVVPQLTQKQRRLSLDLMHAKPSTELKLTKTLAETGVANINVTTKAEIVLETKDNNPQDRSKKKNKLKDMLKRFGLARKQSQQSNIQSKYSFAADKPNRRGSLVGEHLPIYIRKQIHLPPLEHALAHTPSKRQVLVINDIPPTSRSGSLKLSKKQSRIQNLVINSQSLYAYNRDMANTTGKDGTAMRVPTATSNGSDLTTNDDHRLHYDLGDDDENDKEYISPDLLTKFYGLQLEGGDMEDEEGLDEDNERELDEANGFIDVNGSFEMVNDDENDDDYLFKI